MKTVLKLKCVSVKYPKGRSFFRSKRYNTPLKDISFEVKKGEVVGILGRNGAGKSTLLKVLNGVIVPSSGSYEQYGNTTSLLSLNAGLLGALNGYDNIKLSSLYLGVQKKNLKKKLKDVVEISELGDKLNDPVSSYSSGMKARLGFSIAFSANPDVILIDEVLSVGDASFKEKSKKLMFEKMKSDKTFVLVSHNTSLLNKVCDRIVILKEGRLLTNLSKKEAIAQYQSL